MQRIVGLQLIVILLFMVVFGAFGIHDGHHGYFQCVASLINGAKAPCPENNLFGFISFHANALGHFSLAVLVVGVLLSLVLVLFWVSLNQNERDKASPYLAESNLLQPQEQRNFISWFSLHENSPSFICSTAQLS